MSSRSRNSSTPRASHPSVREIRRQYRAMRANFDKLVEALRESEAHRQHAVLTLLAVLAHHGGQVTITKGTLDQVAQKAGNTAYECTETGRPGEFYVTLVEREPNAELQEGLDAEAQAKAESEAAEEALDRATAEETQALDDEAAAATGEEP